MYSGQAPCASFESEASRFDDGISGRSPRSDKGVRDNSEVVADQMVRSPPLMSREAPVM
jgi:hypothetical protein